MLEAVNKLGSIQEGVNLISKLSTEKSISAEPLVAPSTALKANLTI